MFSEHGGASEAVTELSFCRTDAECLGIAPLSHRRLLDALSQLGLERVAVAGEIFDPLYTKP